MTAALIYIVAVLVANLTATAFIPFPVFGQVAVGTLVFGFTFTQRDRMHALGRLFVYKVIGLSALLTLALLLSVAYGWGAAAAARFEAFGWSWMAGSIGVLAESGPRVFVASFLAIVLAEAADTEVFHHFRRHTWLGRVLMSNAVSVPLDSLIFNLVAFLGVFGLRDLAAIIFGEIVVKSLVGAIYAVLADRRGVRTLRMAGNSGE
jgi:uncharacterized integral membrane protein (TIGR00697 family)